MVERSNLRVDLLSKRITFKIPEDVIRRKHLPEVAHDVAEAVSSEVFNAAHRSVMAEVEKRLARHLKEIEVLVRSIVPPRITVAPSTAQLTPNIIMPEMGPPVVHVAAPVVNVPEQPPARIEVNPIFNMPEQPAPVINFAPVMNVPELAAPNVYVTPNIQMPDAPAPVVNMAPVFNVPKLAAPRITVEAPVLNPVFNVPEQPTPIVNVQASEVNPTFNMDVPKRTTTVKKIEYEGNRPRVIVEETTSD